MIKGVAFFAYPVKEMARSRKFYEKTLGLRLTHLFEEKWVEYDIAGTTLAITTMAKELKPGARGAFIALEVKGLNAWVAKLKRKKIPFLLKPFDTPVCRMAVIADPDGNGITLHERKRGHSK